MKYEARIRTFLDNWRWWVGVAYFGLAGCVLALAMLFMSQSRSETDRRVGDTATVLECLQRVSRVPSTLQVVAALEQSILNQIQTTREAINADPESSLAQVRVDSLKRLTVALSQVSAFRKSVVETAPSRSNCEDLARALHVGVPDT